MRKISSGVYGLNIILDGGVNQDSTNVIIGSAGAGKTTFATQFIRRGLEEGQEGIYVSLDENKEQIVKEAVEMGWGEILDYIDREQLVFIDASGKDFSRFIKEELPSFVDNWKGSNARIVVDPLTPVIWAIKDRYEQRDLLSFMFKQLRRVGTVVCTLEEHNPAGDLSGPEVVIPMYLADSVIHLTNVQTDIGPKRVLKVEKCRSSAHSELLHPYVIVKGLGMVIGGKNTRPEHDEKAADDIRSILKGRAKVIPPFAYRRILKALESITERELAWITPDEMAEVILSEYETEKNER